MYVDVDYDRKELAKKYGAKFDWELKKWYVSSKNYSAFIDKFAYKTMKQKRIDEIERRIKLLSSHPSKSDYLKKLEDELEVLSN